MPAPSISRFAAQSGILLPHEAEADARELEAKGWQAWLKTLAPATFSAPFSDEHIEFWNHFWDILHREKRGEIVEAKDRAIIIPFGRGYGKSSTAEMAAIAEGCILGEGYVLYLSDSQLLAEEHLYSVKAILENGIFAQYYPDMASPEMSSSSQSKGKYTQDTIITNKGKWGMTARGLTSNVRGGRIGTLRFTLAINDDIDNLTDSLMVIEKKKRIISRTVFPAMAKNGKTLLAQNLITQNSIASQILDRKTDILSERTVIGGGKGVKAFKDLEMEQVFDTEGVPRWRITKAVPTWEYFNIEDAKSFLGLSGREAFLAEYQHEFDEKRGKVIPNYNEEAQVITWSMFENVFGTREIPRHWKAACGLDVGFSDGMSPHYSYWGFVAVAAMNGPLSGRQFVYRGRQFKGTAIDDQAVSVWQDLLETGDYGIDFRQYPSLATHLDIPDGYPNERGGLVKHWQMSHEATGVMLTLQMKYGFPFTKIKHYKATDGVAQWNSLSRCDYSQPHPFKEDEQLEDGSYLIGSPALFYIVDDDQLHSPRDENGLKLMREQIAGWDYVQTKIIESGLTEEKPSKIGDDSCDVLKGLFHYFGQSATPLTETEKIIAAIPEHLKAPEDEIGKVQKQLYMQRELKEQQRRQSERAGKGMSAGRSIDGWRNARQK